MKYTVSFDASVKVKKNDVKGYLNHCARDTLDKDINHKNQNINKALTDNNITLYNTGDDFELCDDITQIEDYIETRLKSVKKKLRKDAVIMRPLLLQLDPNYTDNHSEDEVMAQASNMMDWAVDTFGRDNIAFMSIHRDETNPHIHVGFVPVTDDGRLTQKEWFPNPQSLRKMHDDLRDHMIENGYNATKERVSGARKRLTDDEYKAYMKMEDKETELFIYENQLKARAFKIDSKGKKLDERAKQLDEREQSIETREKALKIDLNAYNTNMINLKQREDEYELKKERLTEELQADYYEATEQLETMLKQVEKQKELYADAHNLSDTSLVKIREALTQDFLPEDASKIMKCIETKALSGKDKQRIDEYEKHNFAYYKDCVNARYTVNDRKKRRPLSEGLDWSGYDKDGYDISL